MKLIIPFSLHLRKAGRSVDRAMEITQRRNKNPTPPTLIPLVVMATSNSTLLPCSTVEGNLMTNIVMSCSMVKDKSNSKFNCPSVVMATPNSNLLLYFKIEGNLVTNVVTSPSMGKDKFSSKLKRKSEAHPTNASSKCRKVEWSSVSKGGNFNNLSFFILWSSRLGE